MREIERRGEREGRGEMEEIREEGVFNAKTNE
jgi:hypothetical protein